MRLQMNHLKIRKRSGAQMKPRELKRASLERSPAYLNELLFINLISYKIKRKQTIKWKRTLGLPNTSSLNRPTTHGLIVSRRISCPNGLTERQFPPRKSALSPSPGCKKLILAFMERNQFLSRQPTSSERNV